MIRLIMLVVVSVAILAQAGCGEKAQTATERKVDTKIWSGTDNAFAASGWKTGDQAAWEEQMRNRAQAQNDYARAK
jgi:hypothetical protein